MLVLDTTCSVEHNSMSELALASCFPRHLHFPGGVLLKYTFKYKSSNAQSIPPTALLTGF